MSTTDTLPAPPREALAELQLRRLRTTLARREIDVPVETLADLRDVPFTTKDDLSLSYPLGMLTVTRHGLARLQRSSHRPGEVIPSDVVSECVLGRGLHIREDRFLAEVIHPVTLESLPEGALGELVLTTLTDVAMPLVRYRTGDLTSLTCEPCACGRITARLRPVLRRRTDALTARGVRFHPSQVEHALLGQPGIGAEYQLVAADGDVALHCAPLDPVTDRVALAEQIRAALRDRVGLDLRVVVGGATPFIHQ